jgi:hypothetical protein
MVILRMADNDSESTRFTSKAIFQDLFTVSLRLETNRGQLGKLGSLGLGLKSSNQGTQGSFHMSIDAPLPTRKQTPFSITPFALSIAF